MSFELQHIFKNSNNDVDKKIEYISLVISEITEKFTNSLEIIDEKITTLSNNINKINDDISQLKVDLRNELNEKMLDLERRVKAAFEAGEKNGTLNIKSKPMINLDEESKSKCNQCEDPKENSISNKTSSTISSRSQLQSELKELFKKMNSIN